VAGPNATSLRADVVETWRAAAELALAPLLVLEPLERFLDAHDLGTGPIEATPLGDGHSNITYLIRRAGGEWVLRRPPRPPFPASAHNVLREYRVLRSTFASGIRIARPLAACEDERVIGAPFYVMEYVAGTVLTTDLPPALGPLQERRRIGEELIDALAEIHAVDWRASGLDVLAPIDGYLERQLRLFVRLWKQNRTRELPLVERLGTHLRATCPPSGPTTLVHGDFRLGNTLFGTGAPARLAAVLDWEMATLGDPLADVGYLTATWAEPGDSTGPLVSLGAVTATQGFCSRAELMERYAAITGRAVEAIHWYQALALWKAAIFLEGSYRRLLRGTTHDPFFASLKTGVPELAERAWHLGNGAGE
jgi:aminoglycoside phosphotransferase (APT) family kinase protein